MRAARKPEQSSTTSGKGTDRQGGISAIRPATVIDPPLQHIVSGDAVTLQRLADSGTPEIMALSSEAAAANEADPQVAAHLETTRGKGDPLPGDVRSFMEPRFNASFSQVRVHTGSEPAALNRMVQAKAFTHAGDIYFSAGTAPAKDFLTAHELTHVLQQTGHNGSGDVIQRSMGDGHDLSSPRFAGDERLEACFDDQARLTRGASGPSVMKVQEALIELGYDLGPSGADGIYGDFTWNAVKAFKTDEALGFEHMGDVGPGTMRRLDELFPNTPDTPQPEVVDEDNVQGCPTGDDIFAAVEKEPALASAFTSQRDEASVLPTGTPGTHISIDEAVRRFKDKVNAASVPAGFNVSERGQFFWGRQMSLAIIAELDRMAGDPTAASFVAKAREAERKISGYNDASKVLAELMAIAVKSTSPEKPAMLALLRPQSGSAGGLEALLWAALDKRADNSIPSGELNKSRTLPTLKNLKAFDKSACGSHAFWVAERLKKKGGISTRDNSVSFPGALLATGSGVQDRRPIARPSSTFGAAATLAVDPASDFQLGDLVSQTSVVSTIAKMKLAIDAGQVISARVLSGDGQGGSFGAPLPAAKPTAIPVSTAGEHSILIIGYDGNTFVFNDPDAAVSKRPETGFGKLFYDPTDDRLSTAETPGDMPVREGDQRDGNHRYQILSLSPA